MTRSSLVLAGLLIGVPVHATAAELGPSAPPSPSAEASPSSQPGPSADPTEPPFAEVLPRQRTPDMPRFVGPATLELDGTAGRYRWQPVAFGADEVAVDAVLDSGDSACRLRLRLLGDGETLAEAWIGSAVEEAAPIVLPVDYATGELRVDSDCEAWSVRLEPIDDPELSYVVGERSYVVRGDTIGELRPQTHRVRGRWAAYTRWYTSWAFDLAPTGEGCRAMNGRTTLEATITFPDWRRPASARPAVAAEWDRFTAALREHELGHVTIALQGADAIDDRLDRGVVADTCDEAERLANEAARTILERYNRRSARYDRDAEHGRSQGTWFE